MELLSGIVLAIGILALSVSSTDRQPMERYLVKGTSLVSGLSVSSTDRQPMEPKINTDRFLRDRYFQYPQRIVNQWNKEHRAITRITGSFQYPQRIVNQWNSRWPARGMPRQPLSVSSTDRQPMEHDEAAFWRQVDTPFSILNGSSTNGTAHGLKVLALETDFQYPQRIVNQWNAGVLP